MSSVRNNLSLSSSDLAEEVLAAAESCFERFGFAKTTIEDIAKAAGMSRTSVYRYFPDRDSLIAALVQRHGEELIASAGRHLTQYSSFEDMLVEGMIFEIEYARNDLFLSLLISPDHIDIANRLIASSETAVGIAAPLWERLIEEGQERGEVPADLDRHEGCRWIMLVNMILLGRADLVSSDSETLRGLIRQFVLPAFTATTGTST